MQYFLLIVLVIAGVGKSQSFTYTSYRPLPLCSPSEAFRKPQNLTDVVAIVKEAIARNTTVKAFGIRHSQSDIICTQGIPMEMLGVKYFQYNSDTTVTVGAGTTLREATTQLKAIGRGLRTTPEFGNITLGGATGTGAHGSTLKYTPSISAQALGFTIVDGLGNVRQITSENDLKSFRVHLGLLGIIVYITLPTVPLYKLSAVNHVVGDDIFTDNVGPSWNTTAYNMVKNADTISFFWYPSFSRVVVAEWTIVDETVPGEAFTYNHAPSTYTSFNLAVKPLLEVASILTENSCLAVKALGWKAFNVVQAYTLSSLITYTPNFVPIYTCDGITVATPPAVGYYDVMLAPTCVDGGSDLQCPWAHTDVGAPLPILDNEISFPLTRLPNVIAMIKDVASKAPALFPQTGIILRFQANDSSYMATAYGSDTVHLEFFELQRANPTVDATASLAAYQTIMQSLAFEYGARPHWAKNGMIYASSPMLDLKLDDAARNAFIATMNTYDPKGLFMNKFGQRLKRNGTAQDFDPAHIHCALLDNCFCSGPADCATTQTCTHLPGYDTYNVCQTKGEEVTVLTPITVPLPQDFPTWIADFNAGLSTAVSEALRTCAPIIG